MCHLNDSTSGIFDYTLKRPYCQRGRVELRPENPAYKSICLAEGSELQIWGVVTGVVRKLRV
jgi:DNA polymerase V